MDTDKNYFKKSTNSSPWVHGYTPLIRDLRSPNRAKFIGFTARPLDYRLLDFCARNWIRRAITEEIITAVFDLPDS